MKTTVNNIASENVTSFVINEDMLNEKKAMKYISKPNMVAAINDICAAIKGLNSLFSPQEYTEANSKKELFDAYHRFYIIYTDLRDELTKFLNHSGAGTPVFDFKSFEEMRDRVKVGDTVRVRFEEFGMPDKHVVGRMVLPKRAYRVIKIDERRGQHLSGKDLEEGKVRKFHIEQIIEVL